MSGRLLKILIGFQILSLIENLGFSVMANHGRLDFFNESLQPYLMISFFILIGLIFSLILVYKKPAVQTALYQSAKLIFPIISITLMLSAAWWMPMFWGVSSSILYSLKILGVIISILLNVNIFRSKPII